MEHSELFLLLPSAEECEEQPKYIIRFQRLITEDEILKAIENINEIYRFITNENYKGYYDANNVSAFLNIAATEECYPNIKTRMRIVMNKWGENWRTQKLQKDTESYMYYCSPIKNDSLCEITERKTASVDGSTFLLINNEALSCSTEALMTKRNQNEVGIDVRKADIRSILQWYERNRKPQRVFNLNPKHGENGKGAHHCNKGKKVSILMCSRNEAEAMLLKAIGTDSKVLYFFDQKKNQYIEFRRESNNTYHGFHLDIADAKKVPEDIKTMISQLI